MLEKYRVKMCTDPIQCPVAGFGEQDSELLGTMYVTKEFVKQAVAFNF
jgi:hypothetical protein